MDVFPTFLEAAGGDVSECNVDGIDLLPMVTGKAPAADRSIFWEMENQTAVREGRWKLVLNGQLVEGEPPEDAVHLANLDEDMGERVNLKDQHPEIAERLKAAAESWRDGIEKEWLLKYARS